MASSAVADSFTTREDAKKQKALQEARAAGTAAPETDEHTGKMINPHNPEFITRAPWYLNQDKPSLKHHQAWNAKDVGTRDWYIRGTKGDVKTKFIKGACENCGATTHSKKDCVERPRAVTAKQNGKNLMPDEYIMELSLDYDGKRDRWNGFQPDDYKQVIEDWERIEGERRRVKAAEMEERAKLKERLKAQKRLLKKKRKQRRRQLRRQAEGKDEDDTDAGDSDTGDSDTDTDTDSDSEASDDEDLGEKLKDFDKSTSTVAAKDDKLRTTTRNLRIREDTAKYLLNLDVNSAFYDPKSRSMRQDPLAHLKDEEKGTAFRGDNFLRQSGDAKALTELMCFAWDSYKHGEKIHDTAQPTQALKMFEVYKNRATDLKEKQQKELMDKYGGEEHMEVPRELIFSQNENYVEYSRDGRVLKGSERALTKSKYEEDVLIGNHSSTWGSWFDSATGRWGFKCCHQCMKNAYCVPVTPGGALEAGAPAEVEDVDEEGEEPAASSSAAPAAVADAPVTKLADMRSSAFGHILEEAEDLDQKKLAEAVEQAKKKQKLEKKEGKEGRMTLDDERKRGYNSFAGDTQEVTPEEYEAWRLTRQRADDPMAKFA
ncbi:unnamed protein product [Effrenium voratum]|uniref:Pre-mRNA-splicing factor SLU7 n=1 Tax=Effrenium voratum TaxID=2562239 RepID=A0AA36HL71_9DINO|nr:unnamed protein product [Effrenium voratum]CAJ1370552.1 unnamed protein product [Effrenium voratum]CAJ1436382.1 unnamed protein product [Effrenium voratum]|mmetsp:Transcript_9520/g.22536  ORF Transcript_9520/g.22536 Transcript_9520/m.22536 type:complete len:601 (+) Transcript_9520:79-1881(+)